MFIRGRRFRTHLAGILILSIATLMFFQNCSSGMSTSASSAAGPASLGTPPTGGCLFGSSGGAVGSNGNVQVAANAAIVENISCSNLADGSTVRIAGTRNGTAVATRPVALSASGTYSGSVTNTAAANVLGVYVLRVEVLLGGAVTFTSSTITYEFVPAVVVAPPPPPPAPGPVVLPAYSEAQKDAYCFQVLSTSAKATLSNATSSVLLYSANGDGGTNTGPDETNNAVTIAFTLNTGISNPNNIQLTNVLPPAGFAQTAFSCNASTQFTVEYMGADVNNANPGSFSSLVNMDPSTGSTYGTNVAGSLSSSVSQTITSAQRATNTNTNQLAVTGATANAANNSITVSLDRAQNAYRCAQGFFYLRIAARTTIQATASNNSRQSAAVGTFAPTDWAYVRVNLENRCWDEKKLVSVDNPIRTSRYGNYVSASPNWIAVASENDQGNDSGTAVTGSGTVTIFKRNGANWDRCGEVTVPGATTLIPISSVAITDDGKLAVGNKRANTEEGFVTLFSNSSGACSASAFVSQGRILPVRSSSSNASQNFGASLGMSGDRLVVGAPGANAKQGLVYVYSCTATSCSTNPMYSFSHGRATVAGLQPVQTEFGATLALSGYMVAVGAPQANGAEAFGDGFVQVHNISSTAGSSLSATFDPPGAPAAGVEPRSGMRFGDSVALLGNRLAVGSPYRNVNDRAENGSAYYYSSLTAQPQRIDGTTMSQFFGRSVGITTNGFLVGADGSNGNEGRVFHYLAGNNTATFSLFAQDKSTPTAFGFSMAVVDGNKVVVGAPTKPDPNVSGGAAYYYDIRTQRSGTAR